MAYSLHITRCQMASNPKPITAQEWEKIVHLDSNMTNVDSVECVNDKGEKIAIGGKGLVSWFHENQTINFNFREGEISCNGSADFVIHKMIVLALLLNAEVRGDEGELYPPTEELKKKVTQQLASQPVNKLSTKADELGKKGNKLLDTIWFKIALAVIVVATILIKDKLI